MKFNKCGNKTILWNKIIKEVKVKRYAGPFEQIPFDTYIQSPIGLVPKDSGRSTRLIFHLSYPRGARSKSLNANTPKEMCSLAYPDFNKAIELCMRAGVSCSLSKSDMMAAFRNLGIKNSQWRWLVMKAESQIDGKIYYFVDKCLPFGASISCALLQEFSNAISHILRVKTKQDNVNYLDDFLFIALLKAFCNAQVELFLDICRQINFPISIEKTFFSSTQMIFLGFLIDTVAQLVLVPKEKIHKGQELIEKALKKRKITVKQCQHICRFLNFLGRCIIPGRAFTRCMYSYTLAPQLKAHYHINVSAEMKADLTMWQTFLLHQTVYARSFMDFTKYVTVF